MEEQLILLLFFLQFHQHLLASNQKSVRIYSGYFFELRNLGRYRLNYKDIIRLFFICIILLCMTVSSVFANETEGFIYEEDQLYFYEEGERFIPEAPGFYLKDDVYHYYTASGAIKEVDEPGLYEIDGKTYYFYDDSSVHYVTDAGIYETNDKTYFFWEDCSVQTVPEPGFYEINDLYYYLQEDHSLFVPGEGKFEIDGRYYYFYEDGEIFTEGWMDYDDTEGYFTKSGGVTGKVTLDGLVYHFDGSTNLITSQIAQNSPVTKDNGDIMEIRTIAKQSVYGYDTLQGGCTDGTYGYYVLNNRNVDKCKIAKIRLSDGKLMKVSKVLNIGHGNGMTYNSKENYLVVVHLNGYGKRLSIIDPVTLKRIKYVNVKIPTTLEGATKSNLKNIKKFGGVSYNAARDIYVVLLSGSHNLLILDNAFRPISYVKLSDKPKYIYQCINVTDDYILIGMSPNLSNQLYNVICVYEWDGTYRFMIHAKSGYELECVYNIGDELYAGFYRTYWESYYRTEKQITKVKGKKKVKTIKVKDSRLNRANYVYEITDYLWEI